jgi:transcriptional regulator with XRE-family HTH domain
MFSRIRDLREDADLSQIQISKELNISQRAYSHYETGTRDIPTATLIALADFYDVSIDYILGRTNIKELPKPTKKVQI